MKAALARRGDRHRRDRPGRRARRAPAARWAPSATSCGPRSRRCRSRSGALHREGKADEAEARPGREPGARRAGAGAGRRGRRASATSCASCCCASPTCRTPTRPTAPATPTTRSLRVVGFDPDAYGEHQRVPHWEIGAQLGILDNERAVKISGSMFTMQRRAAPRWPGRCASSRSTATPTRSRRSARRRLVLTDDADRHRPAAQVRRRRLRRSSATTCGASPPPRCRSRRSTATRSSTRRELPMRLMAYTPCYRREAGSAGRDTRGMLRTPRVRQGRAVRLRHARAGARRCSTRCSARAEATIARRSASPTGSIDICTGDLGQSHHRSFDIEVYAPGRRPVARGVVGVVVQRLPGPPGQRPLPAGRRRRAPRWSTRSTARRSPCPGCGRPSSRPTTAPTAASTSPRSCCPYFRGADPHRLTGAAAAGERPATEIPVICLFPCVGRGRTVRGSGAAGRPARARGA